MQLSLCLLALPMLFEACSAYPSAGHYEAVFFWFAYRMDIIVYGHGNTKIATGCNGSGPGGSCYRNEFLRYIQAKDKDSSGNDLPAQWAAPVSTELNVDAYACAKGLESPSSGVVNYKPAFDWNAVLPGKWSEKPTYAQFIYSIVDRMLYCRDHAGGQDIAFELSNGQTAMHELHSKRRASQASYTIQYMNSRTNVRKDADDSIFPVETRTLKAGDGQTWTEIDFVGTLQKHPDQSNNIDRYAHDYIDEFTSPDGFNGLVTSHLLSVNIAQFALDRLTLPGTCS